MTNTGTQIVLIYLGQWLCYSYGRGEKRLWQIHNGYDHDRFHASRGEGYEKGEHNMMRIPWKKIDVRGWSLITCIIYYYD